MQQTKLISRIDWEFEISHHEALKPIPEMLDRAELNSIIIVNEQFMSRTNKSHYLWPDAVRQVYQAKNRLAELDKYVVKTPPVTPQLRLF